MATNQKRVGSCSESSRILAQVPQFFKVIVFPFDQVLKIPFAFMRKYGGDLQENVLLKVSNGPSWPVEVFHDGNNGTLLRKGWPEFSKFYSIKIFYFLVFRYEGNSQFRVLIFDSTALEIKYPSQVNDEKSGSVSQTLGQRVCPYLGTKLNAGDDVEQEQVLNSNKTTPTSKGKRARAEDIEDDVSVEITHHIISACNSGMRPKIRSSLRLRTQNIHSEKESFLGNRSSAKIDKEEFKSYQEAKEFRSSRPFFISSFLPSNVSIKFLLNIPSKFLEDHLSMIRKDCKFMLHVTGNNRKWPVILKYSYERKARVKISRGFKMFVLDNNLKVGDTGVFELGQGNREFKITVYRST